MTPTKVLPPYTRHTFLDDHRMIRLMQAPLQPNTPSPHSNGVPVFEPITPPPVVRSPPEQPKAKKENKVKVSDMDGGFDCRICLESLENIRKQSKEVIYAFTSISQFLERFLMEYKDIKVSSESQLQISSIYSVRVRSRN